VHESTSSLSVGEYFEIAGKRIKLGQTVDLRLKVSEDYFGGEASFPVRVIRGKNSGPVVFVSAAVHGDELNGVGIIHELMIEEHLDLVAGTLLLVPVVNVFGFEGNQRYLPDRRDLNRSFPGSEEGSLAGRLAQVFTQEIIDRSDYGIDLHTAAIQRTNFPNIRGDLDHAGVRRLARAFGCELIVDGKGPDGSLRREAVKRHCPTIILEAGEPWKIEPTVLKLGVRGVLNVLKSLGMMEGPLQLPQYQTTIRTTTWVRATNGGILRFHVAPGEVVTQGQPLASIHSILGDRTELLSSPNDGIVLGMATLPLVKPGEAVVHIAKPSRKIKSVKAAIQRAAAAGTLHHQARIQLATNVSRTKWKPDVDLSDEVDAEDAK